MSQQNNEENKINDLIDDPGVIEERDDFSYSVEKANTGIDDEGLGDLVLTTGNDDYHHHHHHSSKKKHRHHHEKKKMSLPKKILLIIGIVLGSLILIAVITALLLYFTGKFSMMNNDVQLTPPKEVEVINSGDYITYKDHLYRYNDDMTSILFMGVDREELGQGVKGSVGTGGQADAIYLAAMDMSKGNITTFQISRDTLVDINLYNTDGTYKGTENTQLCLAYAYGDGYETSAENVITSVKRLFYGLPVGDTYFALDLDGIATLNDSVGGVTVTTPVDYTYSGVTYNAGETIELHGEDATTFVRYRDTSFLESNNDRLQRQKEYINKYVSKLVSMTKKDIMTPVNLYNDASKYFVTNLGVNKVSYLATQFLSNGMNSANVLKVPGKVQKGEDGFAEYVVNEDDFFADIVDTFYVKCD